MPAWNQVAAAGTQFSRLFAPSAAGGPSRAAFATGRPYDATRVVDDRQELEQGTQTFLHELQHLGYWTMLAGKDDLSKPTGVASDGHAHAKGLGIQDFQGRCLGKDSVGGKRDDPYHVFLRNRGFLDAVKRCSLELCADSRYLCPRACDIEQEAFQDDWIAAKAVRAWRAAPAGNPRFLWASFAGPQPPGFVSAAMAAANGTFPSPFKGKRQDGLGRHMTLKEEEAALRNYASHLEHLDHMFGRVLNATRPHAVCIASDNGDDLGDFGHWGRERFTDGVLRVPLACFGPGFAAGLADGRVASLPDLAATIVDLAGGNASWREGRSLRAAQRRRPATVGFKDWRAVVAEGDCGSWKLV